MTVSLEDLVPADNFYRHLEVKLDLSFVRAWVQDCYAEGGRPSIAPVVYRAKPAVCNAFPVKAACTASNRGRTIHRSFYADYVERV
jgi:hypothetical protein